MIIGLQGVQGSGKSTIVKRMCQDETYECVSIDDFYFPHEVLKRQFFFTREHRWRVRGNPGTHDIDLLCQVLTDYKERKSDIWVPVYDKSAHGGAGDRQGKRKLRMSSVLLVEGWCLGFASKNTQDTIDIHVKKYERVMDFFDAFVVLKPPSLSIVYEWREEAEQKLRVTSKGMSSREVQSFLNVYMGTYNTYLQHLYDAPRTVPTVCVSLDASRNIVSMDWLW